MSVNDWNSISHFIRKGCISYEKKDSAADEWTKNYRKSLHEQSKIRRMEKKRWKNSRRKGWIGKLRKWLKKSDFSWHNNVSSSIKSKWWNFASTQQIPTWFDVTFIFYSSTDAVFPLEAKKLKKNQRFGGELVEKQVQRRWFQLLYKKYSLRITPNQHRVV